VEQRHCITWRLAIEQGLRRRDMLNYTAEILNVTYACQHAHRHRRQPSAVDAAHGGQRVHPAPIPSNRLISVCGSRQARRAGSEIFGPTGRQLGGAIAARSTRDKHDAVDKASKLSEAPQMANQCGT
jgi:hypothetical protein